jgi:hypothetical protein
MDTGKAAIAGIGESKIGKAPGRSAPQLQTEPESQCRQTRADLSAHVVPALQLAAARMD